MNSYMKIGFDAKRYFHNPTGLGNYSRTLVNGLAKMYPEHQYYLFNPKPSVRFSLPNRLSLQEVQPNGFFQRKLSAYWRGRGMVKDLRSRQIDLYHGLSHELPVGIGKTATRSVVTVHDLIFERYPKQYGLYEVRMHRGKIQHACTVAQGVIAISEQTKQDLVNFYKVPSEKISVCYQSCDPAFGVGADDTFKEQIRKAYGLPNKFFLYVGSITERKNLLRICAAMKLMGTSLHLPLVVVGTGGAYAQKVKEFLAANGMLQQVFFLAEVKAADFALDLKHSANLAALYQMATALVYPSLFEGFGIPVLEAMWSKTPVITSNTSCLPETGGDAVIYVDPLNTDAIGHAMLQLQNDASLRSQCIERGIKQARQFTIERCTEQVMQVYKNIMEHGSI